MGELGEMGEMGEMGGRIRLKTGKELGKEVAMEGKKRGDKSGEKGRNYKPYQIHQQVEICGQNHQPRSPSCPRKYTLKRLERSFSTVVSPISLVRDR